MYAKTFTKVRKFKEDFIDRETQPRTPWHDLHIMVKGSSAIDLARHFIEYWNYAKLDKDKDKKAYQRVDFLRPTKGADLLENDDHRNGNLSDEIFSDIDKEIKKSPLLSLKDMMARNIIYKNASMPKIKLKRKKTSSTEINGSNKIEILKNEDSIQSEKDEEDLGLIYLPQPIDEPKKSKSKELEEINRNSMLRGKS